MYGTRNHTEVPGCQCALFILSISCSFVIRLSTVINVLRVNYVTLITAECSCELFLMRFVFITTVKMNTNNFLLKKNLTSPV